MLDTPQVRAAKSNGMFMPRSWQRAGVLKWLKRVHAWTGFWGALLFLMMGVSGFFLNHRAILKIDSDAHAEATSVTLPVPHGAVADADGLARWARGALALPVEGREPRGPGGPGGRPGGREAARGESRRFMGREVAEPAKWTRVFTMPDERVTVDYIPGAPSATARREGNGFLGTLKNFHKGVGLGPLWVLFLDTIAGSLIAMSLTGFLLWSRLHGTRLLGGGIALASLLVAIGAVWPSFA